MGVLATARPVARYVWNHPSNHGARVRAMARALAFQLRGRVLHRRTLARIGDHSRLWAELHRTASSRAVYGNPPDWAEMLTWKRLIRAGDLFIDVGANVGAYSVYLAELGSRVEAVEPHPDAVERLRENVTLNDAEVEVHAAAASSRSGTVMITPNRDDMNHVVEGDGLAVPALTLDDLLGGRHARGVKVDVEGYEREVLAGATKALGDHRIDVLQLEWNSGSRRVLGEDRTPVADLLAAQGYELWRPDATGELRRVTDLGFSHDDLFAFGPDVDVPTGPL